MKTAHVHHVACDDEVEYLTSFALPCPFCDGDFTDARRPSDNVFVGFTHSDPPCSDFLDRDVNDYLAASQIILLSDDNAVWN